MIVIKTSYILLDSPFHRHRNLFLNHKANVCLCYNKCFVIISYTMMNAPIYGEHTDMSPNSIACCSPTLSSIKQVYKPVALLILLSYHYSTYQIWLKL